jgi:hypothetical protein
MTCLEIVRGVGYLRSRHGSGLLHRKIGCKVFMPALKAFKISKDKDQGVFSPVPPAALLRIPAKRSWKLGATLDLNLAAEFTKEDHQATQAMLGRINEGSTRPQMDGNSSLDQEAQETFKRKATDFLS